MRFFGIFKKRRKRKPRRGLRTTRPGSHTAGALTKMCSDMAHIQGQVGTINIALKKHEDQLADHQRRLLEHGKGLETLEQKVITISAVSPTTTHIHDPPGAQSDPAQTCPPMVAQSVHKFDISHFSEQERRILAIFFQDKDRQMSYSDVAGVMGKSAHTVKNQMHQIRRKADLFEKMTGPGCRNFFKVKDDLRIEKYLNVGRPIAQPVSTPLSRQSSSSRPLADQHDSTPAS